MRAPGILVARVSVSSVLATRRVSRAQSSSTAWHDAISSTIESNAIQASTRSAIPLKKMSSRGGVNCRPEHLVHPRPSACHGTVLNSAALYCAMLVDAELLRVAVLHLTVGPQQVCAQPGCWRPPRSEQRDDPHRRARRALQRPPLCHGVRKVHGVCRAQKRPDRKRRLAGRSSNTRATSSTSTRCRC